MKGLSIAAIAASMLLAGVAHAQPAAEVLEMEAKFTLSSPTEARYEVHQRVRVNKQNGLKAGTFVVYTDEFRTLSSFSGSITSGGKVIRKLKKDDVYVSLESDALADFIPEIPESASLIFVEESPDKRKKLYRTIQKNGFILNCEDLPPRMLG